MIVYHGSTHNFKKLNPRKSKECVSEGRGIYTTTNLDTAISYGPYVYTIELDDAYVLDFRQYDTCRTYFNAICQSVALQTGVSIKPYVHAELLLNRLHNGAAFIADFGQELNNILDNNFTFYQAHAGYKREHIYRILRNYNKTHLHAYFFTYSISGVCVIKDVSIAKIIDKQQRHTL